MQQRFQNNGFAQRPRQHIRQTRQQGVGIDHHGFQRLLARKCQQALGQGGGAARTIQGAFDKGADIGVAARKLTLRQVQPADDNGQHIVEVMGDSPGQLAHCLHLLQLAQLTLGGLAAFEFFAQDDFAMGKRRLLFLDPAVQALQRLGPFDGQPGLLDNFLGQDDFRFRPGPHRRLVKIDPGRPFAIRQQRHADPRQNALLCIGHQPAIRIKAAIPEDKGAARPAFRVGMDAVVIRWLIAHQRVQGAVRPGRLVADKLRSGQPVKAHAVDPQPLAQGFG